MFLMIFVMFLCYLFTEKLDKKNIDVFSCLFLESCIKKPMKNCLISILILENICDPCYVIL